MGSFIARQPNGLLCRWSSIVDNLTHYDMTEEDYIEYRAECARKEARLDLQNPLFVRPFSEILEKRDKDLVFQCLGVIENQQDYSPEEVVEAKNEMNRLQVEFDEFVKEVSEQKEEQQWDLQQQRLLDAIHRSFGRSWRSWDIDCLGRNLTKIYVFSLNPNTVYIVLSFSVTFHILTKPIVLIAEITKNFSWQ